VGKLSLTEHTG